MPDFLYTAQEIRALEQAHKMGDALMSRAGEAAFDLVRTLWPLAQSLWVVCGPGNNGGDGLVLAALAKDAGLSVTVCFCGTPDRLAAPAAEAFKHLQQIHTPFTQTADPAALAQADVIVDALFGIGLSRPLDAEFSALITAINAAQKPVLALDVPSGLCATTGHIFNVCVRATHTLTFLGDKTGLHTANGPDCAGQIHVADLHLPQNPQSQGIPKQVLLNFDAAKSALKPRRRNVHKNDFGHVAVLGGNMGYAGAALLAGQAALRSGAGLVTLFTRPTHAPLVPLTQPELMARGVETLADLKILRDQATVLAIGPGLGTEDWALSLWRECVGYPLPLIVDADALRLLARFPLKRKNWILTPHPGEAAELLNTTSKAVQRDRFAAARSLQHKYGGVVVLKGCGTLICDDTQTISVCPYGNPYMATAGMGDVLTGILAALLAQGLTGLEAAKLGVAMHAITADQLLTKGKRPILASDVIHNLHHTLQTSKPKDILT